MQPSNQKEECYVLQVLTGQEQEVVNKLRTAGFEVCAPLQWEAIRNGDHWRDSLRTVMPGYVFVFAELDVGRYYTLTNTQGVIGILKRGDTPMPLTCDELIRCQWLLRQDVLEPTVVQSIPGEDDKREYKLIAWPLMGICHELVRVHPRHRRVTVRIPMAGSSHEVTLSAKFI
ncbi:transcription termination/antitermination protein NusG [Eubacterium aggregans]|uniref:transcription termination/antitermination protein NusG n=1 Tax=Eubacterium aggregans TaxID=81409 RepID=UPI003F374EB6